MSRFAFALLLVFGLVIASDIGAAPPEALPGTLLAQQPLTVSPVAKSSPKAASGSAVAVQKLGDHQASKSFEKALLDVAKQAHEDGEISRWDLAKVRIAIRRHPELVKEAEECCLVELQAAGLATAGDTAIDWSAFLDFLKQLIKFLMELFA